MTITIVTSIKTMSSATTAGLLQTTVFHAILFPSTCRPSETISLLRMLCILRAIRLKPRPGPGVVDIYSSKGKVLRHLEHGDWLNAPWGIALAPLDFGRFSHHLLISNFSAGGSTKLAGFISAYDLATGKFDGLLEDENGKPISINGIWSISPANSATVNSFDPDEAPASELYFTAGPHQGTEGLFGYLIPVSTDLIEGQYTVNKYH